MSEEIELQVEVHIEEVDKDTVKETTATGQEDSTSDVKKTVESSETETSQGKSESGDKSAESETAQEKDKADDERGGEGEKDGSKVKKEGESSSQPTTEEGAAEGQAKESPAGEQQTQPSGDVIQEQPTTMATENSKLSSAESERVAPVCQLARAQASIQAKMRPGMWLPGVRNLHMARQIWEIKGTPDECLDKMVAAVDAVPQEELMEVSKLDRNRHFVEIFSFTQNCNWLDVVEVTFHNGEQPGTTRGEIVSFSSGLFPAWMPLSFICNCCCFCVPFSGNGQNTRRIELLKNALQLEVTVRQ